jgi:hypothetical protein
MCRSFIFSLVMAIVIVTIVLFVIRLIVYTGVIIAVTMFSFFIIKAII